MIGRSWAASLRAVRAMLRADTEPSSAELQQPTFKAVYAQYFDFVWSSARRLGVGRAAMDDVVQEIFLIIHQKIGTLQRPESLRSWIYGIVRRTVSGYHRARRKREASGNALAHHVGTHRDSVLTPLDLVEQSEEVKVLWELLEELDPPKREVFVLVELEGLRAPEVAEMLDIPLNTAYSRLRTARLAFAAALTRRMARGDGGERSRRLLQRL